MAEGCSPITPAAVPAAVRPSRDRFGARSTFRQRIAIPGIGSAPLAILSSDALYGDLRRVELPAKIMKCTLFFALISVSAGLASCATAPAEIPAATTSPTSFPSETPNAIPSATPPLNPEFEDLTLIPGRLPGDWSVIGLIVNRSPFSVGGVELDVSLYDADNSLLAHQLIKPALTTLGPAAESPFLARFPGSGAADHARVDVVAYVPADRSPSSLDVDQLDPRPTGQGEIAVYGRAVNTGHQTIEIEQLVIMATTPTGEPISLSPTATGISLLNPGESAPFVTVLEVGDNSSLLRAFASARAVPRPSESTLRFAEAPQIKTDHEGTPLVIGSLHNNGADWTTAKVIVTLRAGDEIVGLDELELPWPLAPGETQAFLMDEFPGILPRIHAEGIEPSTFNVTSQVDPAGSRIPASPPIPLEARVTSQELIGSTLFLKGTLTNTGSESVARPTAGAVLRSTRGEVLSAGFVTADTVLGAGESLPFIMTLRLPKGVDLAMAEFDVRAAGSHAE